ncbi:MAG: hypothetical protein EOM20_05510 [Spartobacteria bacterium]|nr:hypothetical protein [Spartobacteria bacterium]
MIGGFAIAQKGFIRTTKDIDFLVDSSAENIARIKAALMVLPDGAAREVRDTDVEEYNVVRIGDEVMVDLLGKACGVSYDDAQSDIEWQEYEGVRIPFAGWRVLYRTKQTYRESDALDRLYLAEAMHKRGIPVPKKQ